MSYTILIAKGVSEIGKKYLLERNYDVISEVTEEVIHEKITSCDAILARTEPYTAEMLASANHLKVIAKNGVGVDNIDINKASELGIYVTNAPLSNANSVAEHTLGLIMACAKNILTIDNELRLGNFDIRNQVVSYDLDGKTVGIIGYGRIGSLLAKKAVKGLGMRVVCYDPYVNLESLSPEVELVNHIETLLKKVDFVSLHLPFTSDTVGLIGANEIQMMKETAYLINTSRGELIHEDDLYRALKENQIAGAALDVFNQEPPSKRNPLFRLSNVIVTPHSAAMTTEAKDRMSLHAAIGIDDVLSGKKPSWPVNIPIIK
ncbi:hydroxyacid dehydrogenase [Evansella halocellulosilytica]|uniref:hydroxyacid dehydrogenase n=1 Tax=Evansella halocellulosilytica TaxID=2011013 RepID=UPI000BB8E9B7|nr:hydroxyacid dehydrogenase [Evansella halocellulosilytica]